MSYTQLHYHIIFAVKQRQRVLAEANEPQLYNYIAGIVKNKRGRLFCINGALNHIHMLVKLPADLCVSDFIRDVKRASSFYISQTALFPGFPGWAREYCAKTVSEESFNKVYNYILGQKEHHKTVSFENEYVTEIDAESRKSFQIKYFDL